MKKVILFLFILGFILTAYPQNNRLSIESIFTDLSLHPQSVNSLKWFDSGKKFSYIKTIDKEYVLMAHNVSDGKEYQIISGSELSLLCNDNSVSISNYEWSSNSRYLLFTGLVPARKVKSGGTFYIYDVLSNKVTRTIKSEFDQLNATFSPDESKLAFVRDNNIFILDIVSGLETQFTFDGSDEILNGHFDWVYEEEFSIINGIKWSPDSKKIAFWKLDQTNVPEIEIQKWDSLYLNSLKMRYPKPGANNSFVNICIADINSAAITIADLGSETDIYVPRIEFTSNPNILAIQRMNRLQTTLDLLFCDSKTGKTNRVLSETENAWITISDNWNFLKKSDSFIWTSEKDGFNHIYYYDLKGNLINQLTSGNWEVDQVIGLDEESSLIFFTANSDYHLGKDFYSVNLLNKKINKISKEKGTHDISLSPSYSCYIDRFSTANKHTATNICKISGEVHFQLKVPNMEPLEKFNLPKTEFLTFTTADGVELFASIIKPIDFDPSKKYPVLIYNYSGPGSGGIAADKWGGTTDLWHKSLTQKGFIIFMINNRGTEGRGKEFKHLVYKNLGYWEVNDHIEAVKYLRSLSFINPVKIAIWGWSYGGYISALTLMKASDYFSVAISIAPVIDWKFYDSIYSERFMSQPNLNPKGYKESSVLSYTNQLKGKLLLVHGTSDDNVHFQNSVKLVEKLISEKKQFRTMYYPEKDHSIRGGNTRLHLFTMMTEFLEETLLK